jgi:hypothetical protein
MDGWRAEEGSRVATCLCGDGSVAGREILACGRRRRREQHQRGRKATQEHKKSTQLDGAENAGIVPGSDAFHAIPFKTSTRRPRAKGRMRSLNSRRSGIVEDNVAFNIVQKDQRREDPRGTHTRHLVRNPDATCSQSQVPTGETGLGECESNTNASVGVKWAAADHSAIQA